MKIQPIAAPDKKEEQEANKQHIKSLKVAKREIKQLLSDKN